MVCWCEGLLLPHSVIPVVTRELREKGERAAWRLISTLANLQAIVLIVLVGGAFAAAKQWVISCGTGRGR